jgi:rod shape-determining protein MreD
MRVFWTLLAIALATVLQTGLSRVWPGQALLFDPFLLVMVYCGLTRGETHGMLAGAAAGWVQDVIFGGRIVGISGLTKVIVGFVVGLAATRFLLVGVGAQVLVLFAATIADAVITHSLASVFSIPSHELSAWGLASRGAVNAFLGVVLFSFIDTRLRGESRT